MVRFVVKGRSRDVAGSVVRRSRWWLGVAVSLVVVGGAILPVQALSVPPAVPAAATRDDAFPRNSDWDSDVLFYLLRLMALLDGNTLALTEAESTNARLDMVRGKYETDGLPADTTELEMTVARVDIEDLNTLLLAPPPDADTQTVALFRDMLHLLYADVGGNPDDLDP
jgi:hypothetical protein